MRSRLRRLESAARGHLKSFELLDGSRYYWNPQGAELFLHFCAYLRTHDQPEHPEPPEVSRCGHGNDLGGIRRLSHFALFSIPVGLDDVGRSHLRGDDSAPSVGR
jgi:hypothetical protein